ncbi:P-loop containing nucleoside triphosphate hydrolases superfamily protein [Thalictrum thalictroides]|uniref:P-loop containing nucleoside triphosphate hydrolases superfamily protein n=1 Tax=Thalictrum thalictroides TaxID=46969 RepID=A0A7J6VSX7_THATH|nr:P-loop containing nucleoside triphosphate hydrolases superfamily protein [Thalictrum thalictroides]
MYNWDNLGIEDDWDANTFNLRMKPYYLNGFADTGVPLVYVPLEAVMSKYYGESERLFGNVFSLANGLPGGAIIFLDEIDSFAASRDDGMHEATRRILSVLLRQVESKALELSRWGKWDKSEEVMVTERSNGKVFKASTSVWGGRWIGKFLCECSVGRDALSRYADEWVSIVGIPRRNRMGSYAEFSLFKRSNGKRRIICVPEGIDVDGWAQTGIAMLGLFDNLVDKEVTLMTSSDKNQRGGPEVQLQNWNQALTDLGRRFGEVNPTVMDSGEALLFMSNSEQASILANMGFIRVEGIKVTLRRWSPEFNALLTNLANPPFVWLEMKGIPMHLKNEEIFALIVKGWGASKEPDHQSLKLESNIVGAKLFKPNWNLIPRMIQLEENGSSFSVFVDGGRIQQWKEGLADYSSFVQKRTHVASGERLEVTKDIYAGKDLRESYADVLRKKKGKEVVLDQAVELVCTNGFSPLQEFEVENVAESQTVQAHSL